MLNDALRNAINWYSERFAMPVDLMVIARKKGVFFQALPLAYSEARREYWSNVYDIINTYLTTDQSEEEARQDYIDAMRNAFTAAAVLGWQYGGGELPIDEEMEAWVQEKQEQEEKYILLLFISLAGLKASGIFDAPYEALRRADGYSETLDILYNGARVRVDTNRMLTFVGTDGKESCSDCLRLKNVRRPARWWIINDLIPPNRAFECKGYRCEHYLEDDEGRRVTL